MLMRITDIYRLVIGYNRKTQHKSGILIPITSDGIYGYNDYRYDLYYVVDDIQNFIKEFRFEFEEDIKNYSVDYYIFFPFRELCNKKIIGKFVDKLYYDDALMVIMNEFDELIWVYEEEFNWYKVFKDSTNAIDLDKSIIFEPKLNKDLVKLIEEIYYAF